MNEEPGKYAADELGETPGECLDRDLGVDWGGELWAVFVQNLQPIVLRLLDQRMAEEVSEYCIGRAISSFIAELERIEEKQPSELVYAVLAKVRAIEGSKEAVSKQLLDLRVELAGLVFSLDDYLELLEGIISRIEAYVTAEIPEAEVLDCLNELGDLIPPDSQLYRDFYSRRPGALRMKAASGITIEAAEVLSVLEDYKVCVEAEMVWEDRMLRHKATVSEEIAKLSIKDNELTAEEVYMIIHSLGIQAQAIGEEFYIYNFSTYFQRIEDLEAVFRREASIGRDSFVGILEGYQRRLETPNELQRSSRFTVIREVGEVLNPTVLGDILDVLEERKGVDTGEAETVRDTIVMLANGLDGLVRNVWRTEAVRVAKIAWKDSYDATVLQIKEVVNQIRWEEIIDQGIVTLVAMEKEARALLLQLSAPLESLSSLVSSCDELKGHYTWMMEQLADSGARLTMLSYALDIVSTLSQSSVISLLADESGGEDDLAGLLVRSGKIVGYLGCSGLFPIGSLRAEMGGFAYPEIAGSDDLKVAAQEFVGALGEDRIPADAESEILDKVEKIEYFRQRCVQMFQRLLLVLADDWKGREALLREWQDGDYILTDRLIVPRDQKFTIAEFRQLEQYLHILIEASDDIRKLLGI